ncbi:hypothetical protein ccbrp13_55280 [Ktedonobacteria bacterium brp13]|nr:hypothetical protein ccbrp13_55280 [Ktedonobacteria bacterium brp13]
MTIRSTFQAAYLRWLLPIIVLLIMATVLILGPALFTHAAGVKSTAPTSKPASTIPVPSGQQKAAPNIMWVN